MSISHFFGTDKFNLQQLVTPCKGSKKGLLIYRMIAFAIILYGLLVSIGVSAIAWKGEALKIYFIYFTNQTYLCITLYFILSLIFQVKDKNHTLPEKFKNEALNIIVHIFYNILPPLALLVTIVFWSLIAPILDWSQFSIWSIQLNVIQHLFQSIVLLIDWYLISVPTRLNIAYPTVGVGIAFLIFAHIYHANTNHWIYDFLDTSNKYWIIIYIIVIGFWALLSVVFAKIQILKNKKNSKNQEKQENINLDTIEVEE